VPVIFSTVAVKLEESSKKEDWKTVPPLACPCEHHSNRKHSFVSPCFAISVVISRRVVMRASLGAVFVRCVVERLAAGNSMSAVLVINVSIVFLDCLS
jgi:hypothetical protein